MPQVYIFITLKFWLQRSPSMLRIFSVFLLLAVSLSYGCSSYTSITKVGASEVAVVKNDSFLFGITRGPQVWICTATKKGLKDCSTNENP